MDKWSLGPLRLLNFGAWVALLYGLEPHTSYLSLAPLALLERNSLAVFAFHLPLVIIAATMLQMFSFSILRRAILSRVGDCGNVRVELVAGIEFAQEKNGLGLSGGVERPAIRELATA